MDGVPDMGWGSRQGMWYQTDDGGPVRSNIYESPKLNSSLLDFYLSLGIGSSLAFTSAVTVNSVYFLKYRSVALGLSSAGGGIGNVMYSWLSSALISHYGWRGRAHVSS